MRLEACDTADGWPEGMVVHYVVCIPCFQGSAADGWTARARDLLTRLSSEVSALEHIFVNADEGAVLEKLQALEHYTRTWTIH